MEERTLKALGEMVIIVFVAMEKKKRVTASGIELIGGHGSDDGPTYEAIIETIGNLVDLKTCGYKVGDSIVFNEHDIKQFEVPNLADPLNATRKGIISSRSVWGVYE